MLQPALNLKYASRLPARSREGQSVGITELGALLLCGIMAAVVVGSFQLRGIRIPGHVILGAVLPMSLGLAMVPRRLGGVVMSTSAAGEVPDKMPGELIRARRVERIMAI